MSALQGTCERRAIALKTGVYVVHFCVAEHVRPTPLLSGTCATATVRSGNEPIHEPNRAPAPVRHV